jgi:hypothetical protein
VTLRERRHGSATNRRFYLEQGAFWTLPLDHACELLHLAADAGLLTSRTERWPGEPLQMIDSVTIGKTQRDLLSAELLVDGGLDSIWRDATDTRLLVGIEPGGNWRKAMIFSSELNLATFRSLTLDTGYLHTYRFPLAGGWRIDRSMLDADAEIMEYFLSTLGLTP